MFDPEELAESQRNTVTEKSVVRWLVQQPEDERFQFVSRVLDGNLALGLVLIPRCKFGRTSLRRFFERGMREGDASTVGWWLDSLYPGIGGKRLVQYLEEYAKIDPAPVDLAAYWVPGLIDGDTDDTKKRFREIKRQVEGAANKTG